MIFCRLIGRLIRAIGRRLRKANLAAATIIWLPRAVLGQELSPPDLPRRARLPNGNLRHRDVRWSGRVLLAALGFRPIAHLRLRSIRVRMVSGLCHLRVPILRIAAANGQLWIPCPRVCSNHLNRGCADEVNELIICMHKLIQNHNYERFFLLLPCRLVGTGISPSPTRPAGGSATRRLSPGVSWRAILGCRSYDGGSHPCGRPAGASSPPHPKTVAARRSLR